MPRRANNTFQKLSLVTATTPLQRRGTRTQHAPPPPPVLSLVIAACTCATTPHRLCSTADSAWAGELSGRPEEGPLGLQGAQGRARGEGLLRSEGTEG